LDFEIITNAQKPETRWVIYEWTIAGTFARAMVLKILSLELLT
jgi:hypothetical protein